MRKSGNLSTSGVVCTVGCAPVVDDVVLGVVAVSGVPYSTTLMYVGCLIGFAADVVLGWEVFTPSQVIFYIIVNHFLNHIQIWKLKMCKPL